MSDKPKLRPCPWCKKPGRVIQDFRPTSQIDKKRPGERFWFFAECSNGRCAMHPQTGIYLKRYMAVRIWNTRVCLSAEARKP